MLSNRQSVQIPKWPALSFGILSFIGFADAAFLAFKYYSGEPINCSLLKGCFEVTNSQYATVAGIPIALMGVMYYLLVLILTISFFDTGRVKILRMISIITPGGFLASIWFIYLQLFVIKAICIYCAASAVTSTLLFITGMATLRLLNKKSPVNTEEVGSI